MLLKVGCRRPLSVYAEWRPAKFVVAVNQAAQEFEKLGAVAFAKGRHEAFFGTLYVSFHLVRQSLSFFSEGKPISCGCRRGTLGAVQAHGP